jgi:hypothetical protein
LGFLFRVAMTGIATVAKTNESNNNFFMPELSLSETRLILQASAAT